MSTTSRTRHVFPQTNPRPRHGHKELVVVTLMDIDDSTSTMTLRLRDGTTATATFRLPGCKSAAPMTPSYVLRDLRKHIGAVLTIEVHYHNAFGWTVFGRRAVLVKTRRQPGPRPARLALERRVRSTA